jgi:hypothetical protein
VIRWFGLPAVMATLLLAGCGASGSVSPSSSGPYTSGSPSTSVTVPSTTSGATTTLRPADVSTSLVDTETSNLAVHAILQVQGIGPFVFGDNATNVEPWLANQLGAADETIVESGAYGWPLESCSQRRAAYWADAGLTVVFADRDSSGSCTSTPQLAAWMLSGEAPWFSVDHLTELVSVPGYVTTDTEIGLGSTAAELRLAYPDVEFGEWDIDKFSPSWFGVEGMEGRIDWNPIFDVQMALNEFGASLEVDGILGPATQQAITEFQTARGITESRNEDHIGLVGDLGPTTLTALGVSPPADAPVVYLAAGNWAWDF